MEGDRGFKFKLVIPSRMYNGQTNVVPPQETIGNSSDSLSAVQKSYNKCKAPSMPPLHLVQPCKPARQDVSQVKHVAPLEKEVTKCSPGELYSKLFDEVDKIKFWKVKVDTDTTQKERKLQENKRTIETQRKAIQELQFGNESLSTKLEEQISDNEDLRIKNDATRNLCDILKKTFQRSAEKMHSFKSEREETHKLFVENSECVQKLTTAFQSLHVQVEADQQEMQKVKQSLLGFVDLKEKYQQENKMKDEEITKLQSKLNDKEEDLQKVLSDLSKTENYCKQLKNSTNEQVELLRSLKSEKESLVQKLGTAEQCCEEIREATSAALEKSRREYEEIIQSKDFSIQELSGEKVQQAEKLEKFESVLQELKASLALEKQRARDLEAKLTTAVDDLEKKNKLLEAFMVQVAKKDDLIKIVEDELNKKSKTIESLKSKIDALEIRVKEFVAELSKNTNELEMFKKENEKVSAENDLLKKLHETAEKQKEDLKEKFTVSEIKVQELEEEKENSKDCTFQMEQLKKDILQHEVKYEELLINFEKLESEKMAIQQDLERRVSEFNSVKATKKLREENAVKLKKEIKKLEEENKSLRQEINMIKTKVQGKCQEVEVVQKQIEEKCEYLQDEITEKERKIKAAETKLCNLRKNFEKKFQVLEDWKKKNKVLQGQLSKETSKSSQLEVMINKIKEESQSLQKLREEDHQKMLKDLESKSVSEGELEKEVQKLRVTAEEAVGLKKDAELKCQQKIAEMVALMGKHKSQYDRMVEEKDAELRENKKKEIEATSRAKSLDLSMSKEKSENDKLRKQLETEKTEKEMLQKEVADLKRLVTTASISPASQAKDKQPPALNDELKKNPDTPQNSFLQARRFDFSKIRKTPSCSTYQSPAFHKDVSATNPTTTPMRTPQTKKHILSKDMKPPGSQTRSIYGTSKIKSYRIRTPPLTQKAGQWERSFLELEPRSDSSDHIDLMFQRPDGPKSPGSSSKVAAIKRIRDAGWTAVMGHDKKKKKMTSDKIFA
nr:synaptonemal complex protein 1 isoform X1 [Nothobranchius furzeri]XP_054587383.1 synaptonemal complex protein 1 isoform X1 [Nothobranchius furzeri]